MMVKMFRAAFLAAALLISATTLGFAQEQSADTTLSPSILAQLNTAAANQTPEQYAQTVAALVTANPTLAALISGTATQIRPAAAVNIAQAVAPLITSPAAAKQVVEAIAIQAPPEAKAQVVTQYVAAAPPAISAQLATQVAQIISDSTASAGGKKDDTGNGNNNDFGKKNTSSET